MVDPQVAADLRSLREDIMHVALHYARFDIDKARDWAVVLDHAISRLELPRCPECGFEMSYDNAFKAHLCTRHEE